MSNKKVIYAEDLEKFLSYIQIYDSSIYYDDSIMVKEISWSDFKEGMFEKSFEIPVAKLEQKAEKYTCPHCLKIVEVW